MFKNRNSYNTIFFTFFLSIVFTFFYFRPLNSEWYRIITADGLGYYSYLPAKFIYHPELQEFMPFEPRIPKEMGGVSQLDNEKVNWFLNDKFGMFVHWGVYSAMPEGSEWVRHQEAWSNEYYMGRARDPEKGFTAAKFNPTEWAALAKKAGMKYTVLTARHHDGYALFDSKHPFSWTSQRDLGRDLIKEYANAVAGSEMAGLFGEAKKAAGPEIINAYC